MKYLLLVVPLLLLQSVSSAQPPDSIWTYEYSLADYEEFYEILENPDGSISATGASWNEDPVFRSVTLLVKLDPYGSPVWVRQYCPSGTCYWGEGLCRTSAGGYALTGTARLYGWQAFLIVTDADGVMTYNRTYQYEDEDTFARDVEQVADGGYLLLASFSGYLGGLWMDCMMLVRIDEAGGTMWTKYYGDSVLYAYDLEAMPDGGFIVAGQRYTNAFLLRADAQGDIVWFRNITSSYCSGRAVTRTADGGFIVACTLGIWNPAGILLVKTDAYGNAQWERTFLSTDCEAMDVQETWDGGFVILAQYNYNDAAYVIRTDSEGNQLWQTQYGSSASNRYLKSLVETSDGGYIASGHRQDSVAPYDGWIIRLEPGLGCPGVSGATETLTLESPAPNPFTEAVTIGYCIAVPGEVSASVYSLSGELVSELYEGVKSVGSHALTWTGTTSSGAACPSGVYFVRVACSASEATARIALVR